MDLIEMLFPLVIVGLVTSAVIYIRRSGGAATQEHAEEQDSVDNDHRDTAYEACDLDEDEEDYDTNAAAIEAMEQGINSLMLNGEYYRVSSMPDEVELRDRVKKGMLLSAPDVISHYDCVCGVRNLQISIYKMNRELGHNVTCAHCGTILHVPPTVLDHSGFPIAREASLRAGWRDQLKYFSPQ